MWVVYLKYVGAIVPLLTSNRPPYAGSHRVESNSHDQNAPSAMRVGSGLRTARRSPAMARLSKSRQAADVDEGRDVEVPQRSRHAGQAERCRNRVQLERACLWHLFRQAPC